MDHHAKHIQLPSPLSVVDLSLSLQIAVFIPFCFKSGFKSTFYYCGYSRVNGEMSHMPELARAFGCTPPSVMQPMIRVACSDQANSLK